MKYVVTFLVGFMMGLYLPTVHSAPIDPSITPTTNVTCVFPTQREDNSALPREQIASAKFYYGFSTGVYTESVTTSVCQLVLDNSLFTNKTVYIVVTAVDIDGRESARTVEVVHEVGGVVAYPKPMKSVSLEHIRNATDRAVPAYSPNIPAEPPAR